MALDARWLLSLAFAAFVPAIGSAATIQDAAGTAIEATAKTFKAGQSSKGVVLLDVNWGRRWDCGGFQNAELRALAFDRLPVSKTSDDERADLTLEQGASLLTKPTFISYAVMVEPGEYALTGIDIKLARSVSDVVRKVAKRSQLWKDEKALGGTFKVAAGETVYIGNFFLDCYQEPQLWRYYTEGQKGFKGHLKEYKRAYRFLNTDAVVYRLFETTLLGQPYELK